MNLVLILLLTAVAGVTFLKFMYKAQSQAQAQNAVVGAQNVSFESVVPTFTNAKATEETDAWELEYTPSFEEEWEKNKPVLIEEADTVLLLEAEKLITEVQQVVENKQLKKEDVFDKLKAIVPGYLLLHRTDYYDPINLFIFRTLQTECSIELSETQLASLWKQ
jgi:hypothetical protein